MNLFKLRCLSKEARDRVVEDNPGSWGGYAHTPDGTKWYAYLISWSTT